jgi:choice-of-anchor B domain-containing protein
MKQFLILALLACSTTIFAQLNATLRSNFSYSDTTVTDVNDVWGYVAPDGTEYAIVGLTYGVSFVSLADPDNPFEVARIIGVNSQWRDMKTYGEYAYTVADERNEGITAFDLRFLPDSVPFKRTQYNIPGFAQPFIRAHNLYIDTDIGRIYTSGGSRSVNDGGILMFDLNADPMTPVYEGKGPEEYSHDVFVLNDTMYTSEIYLGELGIYDVTDLGNIIKLGSTRTPFSFTHNAWTPTDGQTIFTTDERANAPVAAYDISDKNDIELLFEFRPLSSVGSGVIPHNVHVIDDFLSISYYGDGLRVADASKPDNIIEVANWDTYLGRNDDENGFPGAWGAYPFLPSGLTLVSDRAKGLFVVDVEYKRAARLEGTITDRSSGLPINNVQVDITSPQLNGVRTDALGEYKTGVANGGDFMVTLIAANYEPLTIPLSLINGECTLLDTSMIFLTPINLVVDVVDDVTGLPITGGATFELESMFEAFTATSNTAGQLNISQLDAANPFLMYVTEWGYQTREFTAVTGASLNGTTIRLTPGYMDDFVTDEGWTAEADAGVRAGQWQRGVPLGTTYSGIPFAPGVDAAGDFGKEAYVTDLPNSSAGSNDVDGGVVTLTSPKFGPLGPYNLQVSYQYWFGNNGGDGNPDDLMTISITNGIETRVVRDYVAPGGPRWQADSFLVADYVAINDQLQLIVTTSDFDDNGHLVEAAFDQFLVSPSAWTVSTEEYSTDGLTVRVFPNPTAALFQLTFEGRQLGETTLRVSDVAGRVISTQQVLGNSVVFGNQLAAGVYFAELLEKGQRVYVTKLVKR